MAAGLFELRRDAITGWWVATIVDRAFHRDRFARAAAPVEQEDGCQNCREPEGDGVRLRILKDFAFHVVGTEAEARELDRNLVQVAIEQARASGSWRVSSRSRVRSQVRPISPRACSEVSSVPSSPGKGMSSWPSSAACW